MNSNQEDNRLPIPASTLYWCGIALSLIGALITYLLVGFWTMLGEPFPRPLFFAPVVLHMAGIFSLLLSNEDVIKRIRESGKYGIERTILMMGAVIQSCSLPIVYFIIKGTLNYTLGADYEILPKFVANAAALQMLFCMLGLMYFAWTDKTYASVFASNLG